MRAMKMTMIGLTLLGSLALYGYQGSQESAERPNGDNCFGHNICCTRNEFRLSVSGDITKGGPHQVSLQEVTPVEILPSTSWGGGKVTIPPGLISASFTIENVSNASGKGNAGSREPLSFRITSLTARIKSFNFPQEVITGDNSFKVMSEKSFVQVHGSKGTANLNGEAQALLTNRIFSDSNPARVRVRFWGKYDFTRKTATLTKVEAHAHSPKTHA